MKLNASIGALSCAAILSACGGSGGSSDTTQPTPIPPTPSIITVKAVYVDECGNETRASDAKLLIHNNDFSNKEVISANASGEMNYSSINPTETLSIVTRGVRDIEGETPVTLTSYIDHPVGNMGTLKIRTFDTSQCSCQESDLIVNSPARPQDVGSLTTSIFYYNTVNNSVGSSQVLGLRECTKINENVNLMSAQMRYSSPEESYGVLIPNFTQVSSIDALSQGQVVSINTNGSGRRVAAFIDGEYYFRSLATSGDKNIYNYPFEQIDFHVIDAFNFDFLNDIPDVNEAYSYTLSRQRTTDINQTFDLPLTVVDYNELFEILTSDSGSYSLSNSTDFDYINIGMRAVGYGGLMLDWFIFAPTSGQVPSLDNLDLSSFISDDELSTRIDTITMDIIASGYPGISSYSDYLNSIIDIQREDYIQPKWQRYNYSMFSMTVEANNLSNVLANKLQLNRVLKPKFSLKNELQNTIVSTIDSEQRIMP